MGKLINADTLQLELENFQKTLESDNDIEWERNKKYYSGIAIARRFINNAPVVDAVPVIRCKDCIHFVHSDLVGNHCSRNDYIVKKNDYCSFAERR